MRADRAATGGLASGCQRARPGGDGGPAPPDPLPESSTGPCPGASSRPGDITSSTTEVEEGASGYRPAPGTGTPITSSDPDGRSAALDGPVTAGRLQIDRRPTVASTAGDIRASTGPRGRPGRRHASASWARHRSAACIGIGGLHRGRDPSLRTAGSSGSARRAARPGAAAAWDHPRALPGPPCQAPVTGPRLEAVHSAP